MDKSKSFLLLILLPTKRINLNIGISVLLIWAFIFTGITSTYAADLTVTVLENATEGDGTLADMGTVSVVEAPTSNLTVNLASDDISEISIPATVIILAEQTSATFDLVITDDANLDGTQTATISATASGFVSGMDTIQIHDNETATLTVNLPASAKETDGVLSGQGSVTVSAPPDDDVKVSLTSDDTTEVTVPLTVTIPAGQTSATFDLTIMTDTLVDGTQTVTITASVMNWTFGSDIIDVIDVPDYYWNNPLGARFDDPCNWTPEGPPGSGDRGIFDLTNTYTVNFNNHFNNDRLWMEGGEVTFDLGFFDYGMLNHQPGIFSTIIGESVDSRLIVTNGYVTSCESVLARNNDVTGALVISSGGHWSAQLDGQWYGIWFGEGGDAELIVEKGGYIQHGHGWAAAYPSGQTDITVTGDNSQWYVDGWFALGDQGVAQLTILDEGLARIGKCIMALNPLSRGKVTITGQNSEWHCAAGHEASLIIGFKGNAQVDINDHGKLINAGHLTMAESPGSFGTLTLTDSQAEIWRSMSVGGLLDGPGGIAVVNVRYYSTLSVGQTAGDELIIWPGGMVILNTSELEMDFGGSLGDINVKGVLAGAGRVRANVNNLAGSVRAGIAGGAVVLQISGDYSQSFGASLDLLLAGNVEDVYYSKLYISDGGLTQLDGQLNVSLVSSFTPENTDTFRIVHAPAGISGKFTNAESTYIFSGGTFDVQYTGTEVWLKNFRSTPACAARPRGDLNGDCKVNLIDLAFMSGEWLNSGIL
ncbi:MAG: hypothetical protein GY869_22485 [Planctomycetes bacterium]|nr:hypothetical protein [Planctomycetota bacterium]